ncbi:putative sensor-like histidine kinase [compost metagenome]
MLKMSLQPIIENAVKHAWTGDETGARNISIQVLELPQSDIRIVVTDNGRGVDETSLLELNQELDRVGLTDKIPGNFAPSNHYGIGLRNVQERIRLYYGKQYGLKLFSEQGQYTQVVMIMPKVLLTGRVGTDDKTIDRG